MEQQEAQAIVTEVADEVIEAGARLNEVFGLMHQAYLKKHGRTLDAEQVAVIVEAMLRMTATIDNAIEYTAKLEAELEEAQTKKKRLWRP